MSQITEKSIYVLVSNGYADYASFVNRVRAMPLIIDGMKSVYRRVLVAALLLSNCKNSTRKSAKIVGDTMGSYHPHGDSSIYGVVVSMVRSVYPLLIGQGNFGGVNDGPAAMRYTEVKLNPDTVDLYLKYLDYADYEVNDLFNKEPVFLPTRLPYALLAGSMGMGVGIATNIPAFKYNSLYAYSQYLESPSNYKKPDLIPVGNVVEYDADGLEYDGYGKIVYAPEVTSEVDEDGEPIVVVEDHSCLGINWRGLIKGVLDYQDNLIENNIVYCRDESTTELRLVYGIHDKRSGITGEELLNIISNARKINSYFMNWATLEGTPVLQGVKGVLEVALSYYLSAKTHQIIDEMYKYNFERELLSYRPLIRELVHKETPLEGHIPDKFLSRAYAMTVRTLQKDDDAKEIESKLTDCQERLLTIGL